MKNYDLFGELDLGDGRRLDAEWRSIGHNSLDGQEWRVRQRGLGEPSFRVSLDRSAQTLWPLQVEEPEKSAIVKRAIGLAIRDEVTRTLEPGKGIDEIESDHSVELALRHLTKAGASVP
jgi:hypothetical protein